MRLLPVLTLALLAAAPSARAADDADFEDLRVQVGIVPGIKTVEAPSPASASAKTSPGLDVDFQYGSSVGGPFGWTVGAGLFDEQHKGDISSNGFTNSATCTGYGVAVDAGGIYLITDTLHLELTPFFGIGEDELKTNGVSGSGTFLKYGIDLGGYWTDPHGLQLGVVVGDEGFRGKGNANYTGAAGVSAFDVTVKGNGLDARVSVGYRF